MSAFGCPDISHQACSNCLRTDVQRRLHNHFSMSYSPALLPCRHTFHNIQVHAGHGPRVSNLYKKATNAWIVRRSALSWTGLTAAKPRCEASLGTASLPSCWIQSQMRPHIALGKELNKALGGRAEYPLQVLGFSNMGPLTQLAGA